MTEQEKKILFQAICESLPYGLKCTTKAHGWPGVYPICGCIGNKIILDCPKEVEGDDIWLVQNIVPYLRPLSSMTDKEIADAVKYIYNTDKVIYTSNGDDGFGFYAEVGNGTRIRFNEIEFKLGYYGPKGIDWLNSRHFDYRGLISIGLAIEAPEGMYK